MLLQENVEVGWEEGPLQSNLVLSCAAKVVGSTDRPVLDLSEAISRASTEIYRARRLLTPPRVGTDGAKRN